MDAINGLGAVDALEAVAPLDVLDPLDIIDSSGRPGLDASREHQFDAAIGIDFGGWEIEADEPLPRTGLDIDLSLLPDEPTERRRTSLEKVGRAVLRLRLYFGWSQRDLEARANVDQTTISRLERGVVHGLSIRRLGAILDALHVGDVVFDQPELIVPPTDLEIMLFGDRWPAPVVRRIDAWAGRSPRATPIRRPRSCRADRLPGSQTARLTSRRA
jgi:transcriptional regulator with XRE-family HTH domain